MWSRPTPVMATEVMFCAALVASHLPPMPHSSTQTSISASAKTTRAADRKQVKLGDVIRTLAQGGSLSVDAPLLLELQRHREQRQPQRRRAVDLHTLGIADELRRCVQSGLETLS